MEKRKEWVKESLKAQDGLTVMNVKKMPTVLECTQNLKTLVFADFWCSRKEHSQHQKQFSTSDSTLDSVHTFQPK